MRRLLCLLAVWVALVLPTAAQQPDNDTCLTCHDQHDASVPFVDGKAFGESVHGTNLCVSCHADITEAPHTQKPQPVVCARCHRVESQIYLSSDHGKAVDSGKTDAASCKDCHGHSHYLLDARNPRSPVNRRNLPTTCAACHENAQRMARAHLTERHPVASYNHTVHGAAFASGNLNAAVCSDCHGTHDLLGPQNPASRINRLRIQETCGRCHQNVADVFKESVHGRAVAAGVKEAPVCTDCHGEHTIRSPKNAQSSVYAGAITKTCSSCHTSERLNDKFGLPVDRLATYLDTYHGLAYRRGDLQVANCASCHGFHDVLPSSDTRSSINRANLANTCGRCHPGAGQQLVKGYVHSPPSDAPLILRLTRHVYVWIIGLVIGLMLFHNGLDLYRKTVEPRTAEPADDRGIRLTPNERWQHAVLALSFTLLAYSGFALRFPDAGWATAFAPFAEETRRSLHRWAALVFCVLGVYHIGYLAATRRGRDVLKAMLPGRGDLTELRQQLAYGFGRRQNPPEAAGTYHYSEKLEYWALIWGSVVMVTTGGLLIFNDFTFRHFPVWMADLATMIHFYEAVLACLAILVWHSYGVVFDPKVYPMSWAWIVGTIRPTSADHTAKPHPVD